jgi:hypothetical protein
MSRGKGCPALVSGQIAVQFPQLEHFSMPTAPYSFSSFNSVGSARELILFSFAAFQSDEVYPNQKVFMGCLT